MYFNFPYLHASVFAGTLHELSRDTILLLKEARTEEASFVDSLDAVLGSTLKFLAYDLNEFYKTFNKIKAKKDAFSYNIFTDFFPVLTFSTLYLHLKILTLFQSFFVAKYFNAKEEPAMKRKNFLVSISLCSI